MNRITLKHLLENGQVATRTTARKYTHVLLAKVDKAVATADEKGKLESYLRQAEATAREMYKDNCDDIAAGVGGEIRYKRGQGGHGTYRQEEWHYNHVVEWHAKYGGTLESYIAHFRADAQKTHEAKLQTIAGAPEYYTVVSWHSRADLAKPDHIHVGTLYKVEAINGGTRTEVSS